MEEVRDGKRRDDRVEEAGGGGGGAGAERKGGREFHRGRGGGGGRGGEGRGGDVAHRQVLCHRVYMDKEREEVEGLVVVTTKEGMGGVE